MRKILFVFLTVSLTAVVSFGQVEKFKVIDNGGSGPYKAIAASEETLPDYVVYRPEDIKATSKKGGKLPVLVYANGGCKNTSITHERVLTEIASHGYFVIAIGALRMTMEERPIEDTDAQMLLDAIDWITGQSKNKNSDYYQAVDLNKIAAGGQSCGGAQIMAVATDKRIKTFMMFNSGMGNLEMAGASSKSLESLHGNVIYIVGGASDVATNNAQMDYERIDKIPVAFANLLEGGHMGTFGEQYGGSFASMAIDWLDWRFKGKDNSAIFLKSDLSEYPGWSMKAKNF